MIRWGRVALLVCIGVAAAVVGFANYGAVQREKPVLTRAEAQPTYPGGRDAPSNITRESYVGPEACQRCHRKNHTSWLDHPHRRMNQLANEASVRGDFSGVELRIGEGHARLSRNNVGEYRLVLTAPGVQRSYRITRTIGSRLKQYYAGVIEPNGTQPASSREVVLPFGWSIEGQRWQPLDYFESYANFDPWKPNDVPIDQVCVYCHNTLPFVARALAFDGRLLGFAPDDLSLDRVGLRPLVAAHFAGAPDAANARESYPIKDGLVTVGISCESCHFGTHDHAVDDDDYRFGPSSPHMRLSTAGSDPVASRSKDNPRLVNGICRQCHGAEGEAYPDGTSHANSREAIELSEGQCRSQIKCTDCHNPHVAGPAQEGGVDDPRHVQACVGCHDKYDSSASAQTHSHHSATEVTCLDCHMPRITSGLTRAVRSHRISTPLDPRMLAVAAPNACNVCHIDRSPAWSVAALQRLWGPSLDEALTKPDVTNRIAGELWGSSQQHAVRAIVIDALERDHTDASWRKLLQFLDDASPENRSRALLAIERTLSRRLSLQEIEITAASAVRRAQIEALEALPTPFRSARATAKPRVKPSVAP